MVVLTTVPPPQHVHPRRVEVDRRAESRQSKRPNRAHSRAHFGDRCAATVATSPALPSNSRGSQGLSGGQPRSLHFSAPASCASVKCRCAPRWWFDPAAAEATLKHVEGVSVQPHVVLVLDAQLGHSLPVWQHIRVREAVRSRSWPDVLARRLLHSHPAEESRKQLREPTNGCI